MTKTILVVDDEKRLVSLVESYLTQEGYRVGFPRHGGYVELLNTDAHGYGGAGMGNMGRIHTEPQPWDGQDASAVLTLPPLSVLWFTPG